MRGKGSSWTTSVIISALDPNMALTFSLHMWAKQEMDSGYGERERRKTRFRSDA